MEKQNQKKQSSGFLALFLSLVFGIISVNGIVTEGKIRAFDITYFLENNYGYLLVLFASSFLIVTYIVLNYIKALKILKQKEWVNLFYLFWIITIISPLMKHNSSIYLRLLPVILPILSIYILFKFHSRITGKTIKNFLIDESGLRKKA